MKNLIVYVTPEYKFSPEAEILARIQIDNAISLGQKDNLLLVMNWDYTYNGVRSIIVGDETYSAVRPRSIKTTIVPYLIDHGIVTPDEVYWNHDFDCYQLLNFDMDLGEKEVGLTTYGWKDRWCLGSVFFKPSAKDIFKKVKEMIDDKGMEDETAMEMITSKNINGDAARIKKLNITYQIGMKKVDINYALADKPLKALHFHPSKPNLLNIFMYGKNEMGIPLMPQRLIDIFHHNGLR